MRKEGSERRLAAILFTDIVGYTALMAESEEKGLRAKEQHRALVRPLVEEYHGEPIEARGDESLSTFPTALDAVNCALAIDEALADGRELKLHMGIHVGEFVVQEGEISGDGVNIAARVCALSAGDGPYLSDEVHHAVQNQAHLKFDTLGEQEFKNVSRPVAVFRVTGTAQPPRDVSGTPFTGNVRWRWLSVAAVVLVVLAVGAWRRYQSVAQLAPIRSIAVLPLDDPSNDPEQAYFAFGLTEALIAELAKLKDLRVISRKSVTAYEGTAKSIQTIASELGVQAVIEGSVMRAGDRVRITAQLIDARSDTHLWAESYERDFGDVLALQAEVVAEIAREIHLEVSPAAVAALAPRPIRAEAHEAYLKGVYFQWKRTRAATLKAVSYFNQTIALDPTSPLGHAGLAGEYSCAPTHSWGIPVSELWPSVPREMMARAREHASKALALDPDLPDGHHAIALVRTYGDWDWPGAEAAFKRTLEISPGWFWPQATYGLFLSHMRRFDEALLHLETARALDPLSVEILMWLASLHIWRGEWDQAMARWREAEEIDPSYPETFQWVLTSLCGTDQHDRAIAAIERGTRRFPDDPMVMSELAYCHAVAGDEATARGLLRDMQAQGGVMYISHVSRALVHVGLGETDAAFEALEQAFSDRDSQLLMLGIGPSWEPLRGDPRYADLLDRIGLPRG